MNNMQTGNIPSGGLLEFGQWCSSLFSSLFDNAFITSYPYASIFLASLIPQIFFWFPKTEVLLSIVVNNNNMLIMLASATIGNLLSEIILYYLAKHGWQKLIRKEKSGDIEIRKFYHRYSWLAFLFSPFLPFGTDILVILAGIKRLKIHNFILPMSFGFLLKNFLVIELILSGLNLFSHSLILCK